MAFKREFGKSIPGLRIRGEEADYAVLCEREVRASAGIMLALGAFAFANAALSKEFIFLQIFVVLFLIEFTVRVFINPHYAPLYALASILVRNQDRDWVGAVQKRFAWSMGFGLALTMFIVAVLLGVRGAAPFTICIVCLFFLWAESTLGVCIGCNIYSFLRKRGVIKSDVQPACAGGVCSIRR